MGIILEGAYNAGTGLMNTYLKDQGFLPLAEPYTALGWSGGGAGGEVISPATWSWYLVDWIRIEIRSSSDPYQIVASKHVLLDRNGRLLDINHGHHSTLFSLLPGEYHFVIHHRNHLPVMTMPVFIYGGKHELKISHASESTFNNDTRVLVSPTRKALRAGNARIDSTDQSIKYSGADNDREAVLQAIGGVVPTLTIFGYHTEDVNLDGVVKYSGSNNDRDIILQAIGGTLVTAVVNGPVP